MRSSKPQKVLKSFSDLKILLKNRSVPPPDAPATAGRPALIQPCVQSEHELFRSAMSDVTPILRRNRTPKPVNTSRPKASPCNPDRDALIQLKNLVCRGDGFVISDTPEYIEGTGYRVPELMTRRLHRGDFSIQAFIDLHGLSVAAAKDAFESFMTTAVKMGKRAVLVIHGRGLSSPAEPVLKTRVYDWLTRGRWRNRVIAFSSARACDGGAGATYVLLRQRPLTKRWRKKKDHLQIS
ncbi:MAG: Smr/MutS family protein [Desulfobacterales bacterium]|nr:Smr/MutS family protein [Desulfobacterales bacterium]